MNFVFIVMDTQKGDALRCQGYWREDISPRIDQLAAEGVRFSNCQATAIATGPAFSSLHSGCWPIHHKFYLTPWNKPNLISFDDSVPVASEFFIDHGYTTVAADNLINFQSHMKQFVRGQNYYLNCTPTSESTHHHVLADQVNAMALPWLRANARREPFFMFIHYWDPHGPMNHPESFRNYYDKGLEGVGELPVKHAAAGYDYVPGWGPTSMIERWNAKERQHREHYDEEVRYGDAAVGQVYDTLAELGVLEDTCIVFTSDHGEALGQHGQWGHGLVKQHTTYLPMIIRYPVALPQGAVVDSVAQQADVLPTMLDIAGIQDERANFDGRSLLPVVRGKEEGRDFAITEANPSADGGGPRALVHDSWEYVRYVGADREELFNLNDDPCELINLVAAEPTRLADMREGLDAWVEGMLNGAADPILTEQP